MPDGCCYCGCVYPPHGDGLHDSECPAVYDEELDLGTDVAEDEED